MAYAERFFVLHINAEVNFAHFVLIPFDIFNDQPYEHQKYFYKV